MKKGIYVVRDKLAEDFVGQPLFFAHDAVAVRFFGDVVRDPKSAVHAYPDDHELWCLGDVDTATGVASAVLRVVVSAAAVVAVDAAAEENAK